MIQKTEKSHAKTQRRKDAQENSRERTQRTQKYLEQEQTEETERYKQAERSFEQKAAKFTKVMNEFSLSDTHLCELRGLLFKFFF